MIDGGFNAAYPKAYQKDTGPGIMQGSNGFKGKRSPRRPSRPALLSIVSAMGALLLAAAAGMADDSSDRAILDRVQLLLVEDDGNSKFTGNWAEDSPTARPDIKAIASQSHFAEWTRHEDEFLSFSFPKDPRISFAIKTPEDPISVAGEPVGTTENSFVRCYHLTFNGETYGLLLLDRKSDFDDGICFCGPVVYEKYLEHHGALYRFSLLPNGKVKKIQILGDGLRLVLFEWTHMPIHQAVYARIAMSVQLRQPSRDMAALRARIAKAYGKAGFLEKGMDRNAVVALLGPPTHEQPKELRYVFQRSYDTPPGSMIKEVTQTIPLTDGRFQGLSPKWEQRRWLPPERNSVQWVLAKLNGRTVGSDSVEPASDAELQPLLTRVVELLPKVDDRHWSDVCEAGALLAKRGVKNPRVLEIVRARYLDPQLYAGDATEVLARYDGDGSQELFVKRIRLEMELARKPEALQKQSAYLNGWQSLEELFTRLHSTHPLRDALIVEAMDQPNAGVRWDGYRHYDELPESLARSKLAKGLADPAPQIREHCIEAIADRFGDLDLLRTRRFKETDESVLKALNEAIKKLE
jgi:hypothetical protein